MSATPFTLLLPVYAGDDAAQLELAFDSSVHQQTRRPAEVVIVQDGPVTEALDTLLMRLNVEGREDGAIPVRIVHFPENRGLTAALNAGLAEASHDIIARMDADDVSFPDRFARQLALIDDGYDLVGSGMIEFDSDPQVLGARRIPPVGAKRIRDHARTHNPFNHPTMVYRKSLIKRLGGYEPFGKMEDYWLGVRVIASGANVENIAEPLVKYRAGGGVFDRRGGLTEAKTELRLQRAMRRIGFITRGQYLRNVVMKGAYRLMPARLKQILFRRFVGGGLPGDKAK